MTDIHLNLYNFTDSESLLELFPASDRYEFTSKKVFRCKENIICACGARMMHNGFDYARKKDFGKVKIGKQVCKNCGKQHHEDKSFWKNLLLDWKNTITSLLYVLRDSNVAWQVASKVMEYIIPCSKDKLRLLFNQSIEKFEYS